MIAARSGMRGDPPWLDEHALVAPRAPSEPMTRTDRLRLHVEWPHTGLVVVRIAGEVDLAALPRTLEMLRQRLSAAHLHTVVIDLTGVSYCTSAAAELLVRVQQRADRRNVVCYVVPGRGPVARLLQLVELTDRFACRESTADVFTELHLDAPQA
ncbi:hypothetical protein GCM10027174_27730 [Salinifilum aidingensis]